MSLTWHIILFITYSRALACIGWRLTHLHGDRQGYQALPGRQCGFWNAFARRREILISILILNVICLEK